MHSVSFQLGHSLRAREMRLLSLFIRPSSSNVQAAFSVIFSSNCNYSKSLRMQYLYQYKHCSVPLIENIFLITNVLKDKKYRLFKMLE